LRWRWPTEYPGSDTTHSKFECPARREWCRLARPASPGGPERPHSGLFAQTSPGEFVRVGQTKARSTVGMFSTKIMTSRRRELSIRTVSSSPRPRRNYSRTPENMGGVRCDTSVTIGLRHALAPGAWPCCWKQPPASSAATTPSRTCARATEHFYSLTGCRSATLCHRTGRRTRPAAAEHPRCGSTRTVAESVAALRRGFRPTRLSCRRALWYAAPARPPAETGTPAS